MERIKDALDKARLQREQAGSRAAPPGGGAMQVSSSSVHVGSGSGQAVAQKQPTSPPLQRVDDVRTMREPVLQLDHDVLERHRIVALRNDQSSRGPIDLLRIKLLHTMVANNWRTLGIVSPTPGAGKTVLAINLAMSVARLPEMSSLLLDLDLRSPSVFKYLGIQHEPSMTEFLQGNSRFEDVLTYPQIPRFVVAGTTHPVPNSAEILASNSTEQFIDSLKERYSDRFVIFDLPPLLAGDDAIAVLPKLDCALMVIADGMSTRTEVQESLRQLPAGTRLLGTVFNKAASSADSVNYGY